jgi:hypothetical protein
VTSSNEAKLTSRPAWKALAAHYDAIRDVHSAHPVCRRSGTRRTVHVRCGRAISRLLEEPDHWGNDCAPLPTSKGMRSCFPN